MAQSLARNYRSQTRAVTLVEVLIVVSIIALIAGGVGVAAFRHYVKAQKHATETSAHEIRRGVRTWWLEHDPQSCPDFDELVRSDVLDAGSRKKDAWGEPWHIQCAEGDVTVVSAGPDQTLDTADDIRVPPPIT